jgi:hypothetical protein
LHRHSRPMRCRQARQPSAAPVFANDARPVVLRRQGMAGRGGSRVERLLRYDRLVGDARARRRLSLRLGRGCVALALRLYVLSAPSSRSRLNSLS